MQLMYHFTNRDGYNAIVSQSDWCFKAFPPPPDHHPIGAYFTTLTPATRNLAQRLRIPKNKVTYFFSFHDDDNLKPIEGGRGRFIFYSDCDYTVAETRQRQHGETHRWKSAATT